MITARSCCGWVTGLIACGISGRLRRAEQFPPEIYKDVRCTYRQEFLAARCCKSASTTGGTQLSAIVLAANNHEAGASKWYLPPTTGRKLSSATSPAARPTELAMSVSPCLSGETPYFVPVK